jgi:hypothetical protein
MAIRDVLETADHHLAMVAHRIAHRIGLRGAALGLFGLFDVLWAWSLFDPTSSKPLMMAPTYRVIVKIGGYVSQQHPLLPWAITMAAVAALLFAQMWADDDRAGYSAAVFIKVGWVIATLATWPTAGVQILRPIAVFLILAGLVTVCALGLPVQED